MENHQIGENLASKLRRKHATLSFELWCDGADQPRN